MTRKTTLLLSTALALSPLLPSVQPADAARKPSKPVIRVGAFTFHPDRTLITLPIRGAQPRWKVVHERGTRVAYLEIAADADVIAVAGRTQSLNLPSGLLQRILFAQNRPGVVRIAVRGREAVRMLPELVIEPSGQTLHIRFVPFDVPALPAPAVPQAKPTPAPVPRRTPTPQPLPLPTAAPPSPEPTSEATPVPSLAPLPLQTPQPAPSEVALPRPEPTPEPTPVPEVPEEPEPPSRVELSRYAMAFHEDFAAGAANDIQVPNLGVSELNWTQHLDEAWRSRLSYRHWDEYTIVDVDLAGSMHLRSENWLEAALERRLQTGPVAHALGVGYYLRDVRVRNTMEALAPEYLYSGFQFHHGVTLADTMSLRLWGPFRLVGGLSLRPLNFVHLEEGVPAMPWMLAGGGELGLEFSQRMLGHWITARLSQRHESYRHATATPAGSFDLAPFQTLAMTTLSLGYRF